jgi:cytochrome c peroxidase
MSLRSTIRLLAFLPVFWVFSSCEKDPPQITDPGQMPVELKVPAHFTEPPVPENNPLTVAKVKLGRKLFFDPILSLDSTISCGSCHFQEKAFADPAQFSAGVGGALGTRNAPALINLAYGRSFFWDGANPSLETQVLFPIEAENEMHNTIPEVLIRLRRHPEYQELFQDAFGKEPDITGLLFSIASFERTLISSNNKFDQYKMGDSTALSPSERRGMQIFFGENAECFHCHGSFAFTTEEFHNNGIYEEYEDPGRWGFTGDSRDIGKFKTPTLRNIAVTGPYMHDGSFTSLREVIDHYESGGKNHPNKSVLIRKFPQQLSEQEKEDLIAFLHALTDETFLTNPDFKPAP